MNYALTLRPLALPSALSIRIGRMLMLSVAFWLATALCLAPTLGRVTAAARPTSVCHCAHCPGGARCCCRLGGKCAVP